MSEGQGSNKDREYSQSLPNSSWWIFYSAMGTDCNFLVEKECLKNIDDAPEPEELKSSSKVVLLGVLTTVALLGLAVLMQTPKIADTIQEAGVNSGKQVILTDY